MSLNYIDHLLGYKTNLELRRIEILASVFSDSNVRKLENSNRKKMEIFTHKWKVCTYPRTTNESKKKSKGASKNILKQKKMEAHHTEIYGMQQKR